MKRTLIYTILLISTFSFAQNAIAELKFEEAETAFNSGDYDLTLKKVAEYEKAKGNTTAKSLFLNVVASYKLFEPANFYSDEKQLNLYNGLLANTKKYLKAMESEGLDDKFREIYTISERLKELNLPKDKAVWQKGKVQKEENDIAIKNKFDAFKLTDLYTSEENIETSREKYKVKNRDIIDYKRIKGNTYYRLGYKRIDLGDYILTLGDGSDKRQMQVLLYYFDEKMVSYECLWGIDDDAKYSNGMAKLESEKNHYTAYFGFEPQKSARPSNPNEIRYTWQLGEKTFYIEHLTLGPELNRGTTRSLLIYRGFDSLKSYSDLK